MQRQTHLRIVAELPKGVDLLQQLAWCRLIQTPERLISLSDTTPRRLEELTRFQEDERRLLSQELHDHASQLLAALESGL